MRLKAWITMTLIATAAGTVAWQVHDRLQALGAKPDRGGGTRAVPVETAPIERASIELRRTFTGTLEAHAEFVAASKVSGRLEQVRVDLADSVARGQVVAELDNAEYLQAVEQARADLAVAGANLAEARKLLTIAERELERVDRLRERGVSSESQRDAAQAEQLAREAHVEVTRAQVARAEAELATTRIRLGYTQVTADWRGGSDTRVVAERFVDEGETVSANAPLLRIVELDPITAVFFVTERDYARLQGGQSAELATDAFPGEIFRGRIVRIAPVFRESTRQARVELQVANADLRLKPGMFVRATVVLERVAETSVVPEQALATRDGRDGVFVLVPGGDTVAWREVQIGIRQGERVQVGGDGLDGEVVILGQQLLDHGAAVTVAGTRPGDGP